MDRLRKLFQRLSFGFIHTTRFRVAAGLLILYGVLGFVGAPWAIKKYAPQQVTQLIQRPLTLGKVSFNPFLFRLHLKDAVLTETDGQPIFRLHRLYVDFELLRTLRNNSQFSKMSCLAVSALTQEEINARGGLPEGVIFMPKPLSMHWLNGFFAAIMATRQADLLRTAR